MTLAVRGLIAAGLLGTLLGGCGDEGAARFGVAENPRPGGGGALTLAIPPPGDFLDPLRAATPTAKLVVRQVFEPLVARQSAPYQPADRSRGLALGWSHSRDYRVWALRLRGDVDFQDGEPFTAAAVSANARRWAADPVGAGLLPGLIATDDPRPSLVRFIFASPIRDLPRRLADPRLGVVSPLALAAAAPTGEVSSLSGGTGAFRLPPDGEEEPGSRADLVLQRDPSWWGSSAGLGPALDELIFRIAPESPERLRLLEDGRVRVATGLAPRDAARGASDPLLAVRRGNGTTLAHQRSVHGLHGVAAQPLAGVWIALVQTGGTSP